jgi:hypothetical protein
MPFTVVQDNGGIVARYEEFIRDYAAIPQSHYPLAIALWALATYVYEKFDAFGYLVFRSDAPGAGKSRMLEILAQLCCRAQLQAKITLTGLCSKIEESKPTILLDQAERLPKNEHADLMACILAGYRPDIMVTVQRKGGSEDRPIYCPKAFALIGDLFASARESQHCHSDAPRKNEATMDPYGSQGARPQPAKASDADCRGPRR